MDTFTHSYSKQRVCPLRGAQLHIGNKICATFRCGVGRVDGVVWWGGYPRGNGGGTVTGDEQGFCTGELFTLTLVILERRILA